jgi:type I restriction-modification system DNA methylase subunit
MARVRCSITANQNGFTLGFEATLWAAADKLRNNMDPRIFSSLIYKCVQLADLSTWQVLLQARGQITSG